MNLAWVLMALQCQQGAEGRQERQSFSWNHLKKGGEIKIFTQKKIKMVKTANEFFEWLSRINSNFLTITKNFNLCQRFFI